MITAIMILYKTTKAIVQSSDGNPDLFNIVAVVMQGDILAQYLLTLCRAYVLQNP